MINCKISYRQVFPMKVQTVPAKTFLSKSKIPGVDYVINPYIGCPHNCIYCYAEYMRKFTGHEEEWGTFLDIKSCEVPLKPAQLFHRKVMLCSATDPYNPVEEEQQLTRKLLKQLIYCQADVSILTKSALVVRDIDLFKQLYRCEVGFSFSSVDEQFCALAEPGASSAQQRTQALKTIHQEGIFTVVMAAPLLPGISDWKSIVEKTRPYTNFYRFDGLNLRPGFQKKVISFIAAHYPHTLPLYSEIYLRGNNTYWQQLAQEIRTYCAENHLKADLFFD